MDDLKNKICTLMADVFECGIEEITESAQINNVKQWNSLSHMKMVLALEEMFSIEISPVEAIRLITFKAIFNFLQKEPKLKAVSRNLADNKLPFQKQFEEGLRNVGLTRGDVVLVHSFSGALASAEGGFAKVLAAFNSVIGDDGTLVMPAFTSAFVENGYLDREKSTSEVGMLTDYFLKEPDVSISPHPYHRFVATGRHAREVCESHSNTSFGPDSPMARMCDLNAKILLISVDWGVVTFFHYVEELFQVPYREFKTFEGDISSNGLISSESWRMFVRPLGSGVENNFDAFGTRFLKTGLSKKAENKLVSLESIDMKVLLGYTVACLEMDAECLIKRSY